MGFYLVSKRNTRYHGWYQFTSHVDLRDSVGLSIPGTQGRGIRVCLDPFCIVIIFRAHVQFLETDYALSWIIQTFLIPKKQWKLERKIRDRKKEIAIQRNRERESLGVCLVCQGKKHCMHEWQKNSVKSIMRILKE